MADLVTIKGSGRWLSVTPSNTVDLTEVPRAIQVNVAGDVNMDDGRGNTVVFTLLASVPYPYHPRRIRSTSTTATGIIALY